MQDPNGPPYETFLQAKRASTSRFNHGVAGPSFVLYQLEDDGEDHPSLLSSPSELAVSSNYPDADAYDDGGGAQGRTPRGLLSLSTRLPWHQSRASTTRARWPLRCSLLRGCMVRLRASCCRPCITMAQSAQHRLQAREPLPALSAAARPHLLDLVDDGLGRRSTSAGPAMACGGTGRSGEPGNASNKLKPALLQRRFGQCSMKLPRRKCGATSLSRRAYR